jgi:hypothetical protein
MLVFSVPAEQVTGSFSKPYLKETDHLYPRSSGLAHTPSITAGQYLGVSRYPCVGLYVLSCDTNITGSLFANYSGIYCNTRIHTYHRESFIFNLQVDSCNRLDRYQLSLTTIHVGPYPHYCWSLHLSASMGRHEGSFYGRRISLPMTHLRSCRK